MPHTIKKIKDALRQVNLDFEADFMRSEHLEKLTNEVLGLEKELREMQDFRAPLIYNKKKWIEIKELLGAVEK